jgi:dienelactone hydrolase
MTAARAVACMSLLGLAWLITGALRQGPPAGQQQLPLGLAGQVPATLYFKDAPGTAPAARPGLQRPAGAFAAGVVVAHGFAGDRHTMQGLCESLAAAGYSVLSLDLSGHGMNRNPLASPLAASDGLVPDIRAGVDFLAGTLGIDPRHIVVLGHSMGARAALDYGSSAGAGVAGLVMLAGSSALPGPQPPRNTLFLYAERDLPGVAAGVRQRAAALAGVMQLDEGRTYGDFAAGTAVRVVQVAGVVHGTIISAPRTFNEVLDWLDRATGFPARATAPTPITPAPLQRLLWLGLLATLPGLGLLLARLAPPPAAATTLPAWADFALLPLALLLPLAFIRPDRAGLLLALSTADGVITQLAMAGLLLTAGLLLAPRYRPSLAGWVPSLWIALAGWLAMVLLVAPASDNFHGVGLTPGRAALALGAAAGLMPLALALQWLACRPQWWRGTLLRLALRGVLLSGLAAGNALGAFGFPGTIAALVLLLAPALLEPVLAGYYLRSRNLLVAAGLDALVTGWLFALYLPVTG